MPKYNITVEETFAKVVEIEAEDVEQAIDIASGIQYSFEPLDYISDSFTARHFED